jgi:hypothetical protein
MHYQCGPFTFWANDIWWAVRALLRPIQPALVTNENIFGQIERKRNRPKIIALVVGSYRQTDEQTYGQTDEQTDGQTDQR